MLSLFILYNIIQSGDGTKAFWRKQRAKQAKSACVLAAYDVSHRGQWVMEDKNHIMTISNTWQASVAAKFDSRKKKYVIDYVTYGHTLSLLKKDETPKRTLSKKPILSWFFQPRTLPFTRKFNEAERGLSCEDSIIQWGTALQQNEDLFYEPQATLAELRPQRDAAILAIARRVWHESKDVEERSDMATISHIFGPQEAPIATSIILLKDATPIEVYSIHFTKSAGESIRIPLLPINVILMRSEPHIWEEDDSWDIVPTPLVEYMARQWGLVGEGEAFTEASNWEVERKAAILAGIASTWHVTLAPKNKMNGGH